jgi:class 3 adenylate cyclase
MRSHQQLLREALQGSRGEDTNTYGDAFFAAFRSAADAVAAAAAAQRALYEHPWPDRRRVLVRMGLNAGVGAIAGESYVGVAIHRAARLCGIAQGGQVLLSQATGAIASDEALEGLRLRDRGERRLKDFEHSERVYELLIDGLPRPKAARGRRPFLPVDSPRAKHVARRDGFATTYDLGAND